MMRACRRMMSPGAGQGGMTLLEVLVAMAIFSIIAAAGYSTLAQWVKVQARLQEQADFWRRLELVFSLIETDLAQATDRAPRIPGLIRSLSFEGSANGRTSAGGDLFQFTSGANASFRDTAASPYLRIAYRIQDEALYRVIWPRVDRPYGQQGLASKTLDGVDGIRLRYLVARGKWVDSWNVEIVDDNNATLPRAVEMTLTLKDRGSFQRIFHVGLPGW